MSTSITFQRVRNDTILLNGVRFESLPINDDDAIEMDSFSERMLGGFKNGEFFRGVLSFDFAAEKVTLTLSQHAGEIGSISMSREEFNKIQPL